MADPSQSDGPVTDSPVAFGEKVLALLDTGSFTTSYKYALLLAILDAVLEETDAGGQPPRMLSARDLGRRVFELYWQQARPYSDAGPLRQSGQRDLVIKTAELRERLGLAQHTSVHRARQLHPREIGELEREVVATVVRYPVPLLQRFGSGARARAEPFIYTVAWDGPVTPSRVHRDDFDDRLRLLPGAAEHLITLTGLLRPVVEREWLRHVARRNEGRVDELQLERFLFGAERISLEPVREPLLHAQQGRCFYCGRERGPWEVDHFLPWSRLPDNRLDNLVVADRTCNSDKRDALPGLAHLDRWWDRLDTAGPSAAQLHRIAEQLNWPRRPDRTAAAARGLYLHQPAGALLWAAPGTVEALDRTRLHQTFAGVTLAAEDSERYDEDD